MLTYIHEFGKYCEITGFKNVKIRTIETFLEEINNERPLDVVVQFFDGDVIATWQHLHFAVLNALMAFQTKENISRNLSMEIMLHASARRQILQATKLVGIKPKSLNIATLVIGGKSESVELALKKISKCIDRPSNDSVLEFSKEKIRRIRKAFGISNVELETVMERDGLEEAIVDLVIERIALLMSVH